MILKFPSYLKEIFNWISTESKLFENPMEKVENKITIQHQTDFFPFFRRKRQ